MQARSHWPRSCCPPTPPTTFFNRLCTVLFVRTEMIQKQVIIQFFMCVTSLLSSMPFILQTCLTPSAKLVVISLAALHIPLIFYCNHSYLCAGLTRAPACRHALLVLQNVVYVKQLTRNPKGLLQVQCRKPKPPQILLITIKTEQPWKYKIMYQIHTFVVVVLCFSQWHTTWASYQHKHCV